MRIVRGAPPAARSISIRPSTRLKRGVGARLHGWSGFKRILPTCRGVPARPLSIANSTSEEVGLAATFGRLLASGTDQEAVVGVLGNLEPEILLIPEGADAVPKLLEIGVLGRDLVIEFVRGFEGSLQELRTEGA